MKTINDLQVGDQVGNYSLVRKVGQGGLGEVWLGSHIRLAHKPLVAIKFVLQPRAQELERFRREVEILDMLRLNHHILQAEDCGEHNGYPYLVMEYAPNGDLAERMKKELNLTFISHLLDQLADALDFFHHKGVVHRDLKPSNILFGEGDRLLVADFGIAHEENYELTEVGIALGTLEYMAPEQFTEAKNVTSSADIYSLGIITFQMVTGKLPFGRRTDGLTPYQLMRAHCTDPVPQLWDFDWKLPFGLQAVIEKALAKNPQDRYQTATEFASAFRTAIGAEPLPEKPRLTNLGRAAEPLSQSAISGEAYHPQTPWQASLMNGPGLNETPSPPGASPGGESNPLSSELHFTSTNPDLRRSPFGNLSYTVIALGVVSVLLLGLLIFIVPGALKPGNANPNENPGKTTESGDKPNTTVTPANPNSTPPVVVTTPVPAVQRTPTATPKVKVPDLYKKTLMEAQNILRDAQLQVGDITYDYNNDVELGRVITTSVKAGTEVEPNTRVGMLISKGKK